MKTILQKYIAHNSVYSRRNAETLIKQGFVLVNGQKANLGMSVEETDLVTIRGKAINQQERIYLKLNKPREYTCTNRKFSEEKNIFSLLPKLPGLFVVGRLDKNSEGLILVTNDGDLAQKITHPSFEHEKEYEVVIKDEGQTIDVEKIKKSFKKGFMIQDEDGSYLAKAKSIKHSKTNCFQIVLTQGKKRQIRMMFEAFGLKVSRLKRTRIINIQLGNLALGKWEYLSEIEKEKLFRLTT
jgi:pseudouridine synthase